MHGMPLQQKALVLTWEPSDSDFGHNSDKLGSSSAKPQSSKQKGVLRSTGAEGQQNTMSLMISSKLTPEKGWYMPSLWSRAWRRSWNHAGLKKSCYRKPGKPCTWPVPASSLMAQWAELTAASVLWNWKYFQPAPQPPYLGHGKHGRIAADPSLGPVSWHIWATHLVYFSIKQFAKALKNTKCS